MRMKLPCVAQTGAADRNQTSAVIANACLVTTAVIPGVGNSIARMLDIAGSA